MHMQQRSAEGLLVVKMKDQRCLHMQQRWAEEDSLLVVMVKGQRRLHESATLGRGRGAVSCQNVGEVGGGECVGALPLSGAVRAVYIERKYRVIIPH